MKLPLVVIKRAVYPFLSFQDPTPRDTVLLPLQRETVTNLLQLLVLLKNYTVSGVT
jgi:hypothetical protein